MLQSGAREAPGGEATGSGRAQIREVFTVLADIQNRRDSLQHSGLDAYGRQFAKEFSHLRQLILRHILAVRMRD